MKILPRPLALYLFLLCLSNSIFAETCLISGSGIGGTGMPLLHEGSGIGGTGSPVLNNNGSGIGGTGSPILNQNGSGIGGTGLIDNGAPNQNDTYLNNILVIGTITEFGSICVNGIRIQYSEETPVNMNGKAASIDELAIGQVVHVNVSAKKHATYAESIHIFNIVSGPVTEYKPLLKQAVVLGNTIVLTESTILSHPGSNSDLQIGDFVQVSGFRQKNGLILARRIEISTDTDKIQITGIARKNKAGSLSIAGISVAPETEQSIEVEQQLSITGYMENGRLVPEHLAIVSPEQGQHVILEGLIDIENEGRIDEAIKVRNFSIISNDQISTYLTEINPNQNIIIRGHFINENSILVNSAFRVDMINEVETVNPRMPQSRNPSTEPLNRNQSTVSGQAETNAVQNNNPQVHENIRDNAIKPTIDLSPAMDSNTLPNIDQPSQQPSIDDQIPQIQEIQTIDEPEIEEIVVPEMPMPEASEIELPDAEDLPISDVNDLELPELENLEVPEIEDIEIPEIEIPDFEDIEIPELEELEIEMPEMEEIEQPEIEIPEMEEIEQPEIEIPEMEEIEQPEIEMPEMEEIEQPEIEIPEMEEIEQPEIEMPEMEEIEQPEIEMPEMEEIEQPEIEEPEMEEIEQPEIEEPEMEEIEQPEIEEPEMEEIEQPEIEEPEMEEIEQPEIEEPEMEEIEQPEIEEPEVEEVEQPEIEEPEVEEVEQPEIEEPEI